MFEKFVKMDVRLKDMELEEKSKIIAINGWIEKTRKLESMMDYMPYRLPIQLRKCS